MLYESLTLVVESLTRNSRGSLGLSRQHRRRTGRPDIADVQLLEKRQMLSAGAVDTTFGKAGSIATANTGTLNDSALEANGKIVIVTEPNSTQTKDTGVIRVYNSDGSSDLSFGHNGVVELQYTQSQFLKPVNAAVKVAALANGQLLVVGNETDHILLTRLNSNGQFDATFNNGSTPIKGVIASSFIGFTVTSLVVLPNQKILVGGSALDSQFNQVWGLAQFNTDGSVDKTFGNGGHVMTPLAGTFPTIKAIAVQHNGDIVAAGYTDNDQTGDVPVVVRYTPNGALDRTFGSGGISTPQIASDGLFVSVAVESDGKIVLGALGSKNGSDPFIGLVTRLNTNGALDTRFGSGGVVQMPLIAGLSSVSLLPSGQILVAGGTDLTTGVVRMTRLTTIGAVDSTFGTRGTVSTKFGTKNTAVQPKILLTSTGRVLLVGAIDQTSPQGTVQGIGMTRFLNA